MASTPPPLPQSGTTRRRSYRRLPPVETGLKGRCPRCGEGALFAGFLKFVDICAACGADFRDEDAGDGPAVFVILLAGIIIVPMALAFQLITNAPSWLVFLIWGPILIVFCLLVLRLLRGVMFNIAWRHNAREIKASDVKQSDVKETETKQDKS